VNSALLELSPQGLYCPAGRFHIDPWLPVPRAVITHAHADHARWGSERYLAAQPGEHLLRTRLGAAIDLETLPYGEQVVHNGVAISFHPAGHVLGSAQIRLEHAGQVVVVSGDYKLQPDATCAPFEPVRCHLFVTESTFGLPIYRWAPPIELFDQINAWWRANRDVGKSSLLFAYALGKAQRLLAGLDPSIGPIYLHGAVEKVTNAYREGGVALPATRPASEPKRGSSFAGP
jgi:putative mRNA 3-end processing factor